MFGRPPKSNGRILQKRILIEHLSWITHPDFGPRTAVNLSPESRGGSEEEGGVDAITESCSSHWGFLLGDKGDPEMKFSRQIFHPDLPFETVTDEFISNKYSVNVTLSLSTMFPYKTTLSGVGSQFNLLSNFV